MEEEISRHAMKMDWLILHLVSTFSIPGRFYVGQNVYISYTTASPDNSQDWKAAVQAWYDEVKDFNKNNVDPFQ
jgi:hypothetical protein